MNELSLNSPDNVAHQVASDSTEIPSGFDVQVLIDLRELIGEDADLMVPELIECFIRDTSELLQVMTAAIAEANAPELRTAAHSLKSSSASLGAMGLSELARELEVMAQQGNLDLAPDKVTQISAEFEKVRPFLLSEINDQPN